MHRSNEIGLQHCVFIEMETVVDLLLDVPAAIDTLAELHSIILGFMIYPLRRTVLNGGGLKKKPMCMSVYSSFIFN